MTQANDLLQALAHDLIEGCLDDILDFGRNVGELVDSGIHVVLSHRSAEVERQTWEWARLTLI